MKVVLKTKNFTIESNITYPAKRRKSKYDRIPFLNMKVGECVLLERCSSSVANARYKSIYSGLYKALRRGNVEGKFKMGVIDSENEKGKSDIRVWRVE